MVATEAEMRRFTFPDAGIQLILALRPNMSREQLFRTVLPGGAVGRVRAMVSPVRGVADVYVPFYLFKVEYENRGRREARELANDAVNGSLDLYSVDADGASFVEISTRNVIPAVMGEVDAARALIEKTRRMIFRSGFFSMRDPRISASVLSMFYVPYWVVMIGSPSDLRLRVLDAVRGRAEGAKVRTIIRHWLAA